MEANVNEFGVSVYPSTTTRACNWHHGQRIRRISTTQKILSVRLIEYGELYSQVSQAVAHTLLISL